MMPGTPAPAGARRPTRHFATSACKGTMTKRILCLCCLVISALLASQARADDCQLADYGTFPVEMLGGRATTMVKIDGKDTRFALDTRAAFDFMSRANALALGLKLRPAPFGYRMRGVGGSADVHFVEVKEFGILDTTLKHVGFIVGGTDTGYGLLGTNLLDVADLEVDLAHGKLNLFKPEHCKKLALTYWTKGAVTTSPISSRPTARPTDVPFSV